MSSEPFPFYESKMGFQVVSQSESPVRSAVLARDDVQIGLAENGGDPSQEGCFFEVDDVGLRTRNLCRTDSIWPLTSNFRNTARRPTACSLLLHRTACATALACPSRIDRHSRLAPHL